VIVMLRRLSPLLLIALLLLPATADAAVSRKKAIWGPVEIDSESQFPLYRDLGAGIYQTTLSWDQVAAMEPEDASDVDDPSYDWPDEIDTAISEGKSNGIQVALTVTGAPEWANGGKPANYGPTDADDFADFVAAASERYPAVKLWSIWDGPSDKTTFHGASAAKYAQLLDGAYGKLKAANKANRVIGGNSNAASATKWIAKLELPNGKRPRMDLYGHDLSARKAPTASSLKGLERQVDKLGDGLELYLSPVTLPTSGPGEGPFGFHLTQAAQASWLTSAFRLARADRNVATLGYRGLRDLAETVSITGGLMTIDGEKKPSFNAFKRG
jgi:hypothetical protein